MGVPALTIALAAALTGCGLAAAASPALAPDTVAAVVDPAPAAAEAAAEAIPLEAAAVSAAVEPAPAVAVKATLTAADVGPMTHVSQTLNNCGPASVAMALSTLGVSIDQETARLALRGPDVRRGMGPAPVDGWVSSQFGLRAVWRNNGTNDLIKALVSNGFAPLVTQWMEDPTVSRIAHWRTVRGYDDSRGAFIVNDPMRGANVALGYDRFTSYWQPFSYRYLVIYRPQDEALLKAIVGPDWSDRRMRERSYERARTEALTQGTSAAWLALGDAAYANGLFADAVAAFERGLALGSAQGVFTVRSTYPQALRALGRYQEAAAAQERVGGGTAVPQTVAPAPDPLAVRIALERTPLWKIRLSEQP